MIKEMRFDSPICFYALGVTCYVLRVMRYAMYVVY